jgi:hypothetical protein
MRRIAWVPMCHSSRNLKNSADNSVVVESFKNIQENLTGVGIKLG